MACLLVGALAAALAWSNLHGDFVFDDMPGERERERRAEEKGEG